MPSSQRWCSRNWWTLFAWWAGQFLSRAMSLYVEHVFFLSFFYAMEENFTVPNKYSAMCCRSGNRDVIVLPLSLKVAVGILSCVQVAFFVLLPKSLCLGGFKNGSSLWAGIQCRHLNEDLFLLVFVYFPMSTQRKAPIKWKKKLRLRFRIKGYDSCLPDSYLIRRNRIYRI